MSETAKDISNLIDVNIKIWHEVTKVKDISGSLYDENKMNLNERVECALKIRELNAHRSKARWSIDSKFNSGTNETKIFTK